MRSANENKIDLTPSIFSTTDPTYGLTTFGYDGLSRVTSVTTPDGAVVTTNSSGNQTTVTDPAGKARKSKTDALGHLVEVTEDPNGVPYVTTYGYDALDDLKSVQQGVQTRSFVYNSLKQLTSATNPESGTVSYVYDPNGNLTSKSDARGITTSYAYDALNRVTSRSYSDLITPAVSYTYDAVGVANSRGRLTQISSTVSMTNFTGYDAMGRVTGSSQVTNGQAYNFSYGYTLAGGLTSQTYPSGRTVTTSYDGAGRVSAVNGIKTGEASKAYSSSMSYAPQGAVTSMTLGNTLVETSGFNSRFQQTSIGLGALASFNYTFGTTNNNGNVLAQTIGAPGFNVTQNYTYDALNRLTSVNENGVWSQTYGYDRYGNRASVVSPTYMPTFAPAPTVSASNNRFIDANFFYDAVGNLTQEPIAPGSGTLRNYTYDAENRLTNFNIGAATYGYDGEGRRVKKTVGTTTTVFVYNVAGQLIAEHTNPVPTSNGGTSYLTADHLGSTRVVTNQSAQVISRHDYLPFGEEIPSSIGGRSTSIGYAFDEGIRQRFTAKERDLESGLAYFGARYHASSQGRFMGVDPSMDSVALRNPQSWNRCSYTVNNPLRYIDADGELWVQSGDKNNPYSWVDECRNGRTCYNAVAAAIENNLRIYGSNNAQDITNITANEHGMMDLNTINQQHDAAFDVKTDTEYSFVTSGVGAMFFNFVNEYQQNYPGAPNLVVTEAGAFDSSLVPGHTSHRGGKQIDLRYVDVNGNPLQSTQTSEASSRADSNRMWDIFDMAYRRGFTQNYSARPDLWDHTTQPNSNPHTSHFHLSIPNPRPPNR